MKVNIEYGNTELETINRGRDSTDTNREMEKNNISKKHISEKKTENVKKNENPKINPITDKKNTATFCQLQYLFITTTFDKIVFIFAVIGSLTLGISRPLLSIILGSTINTLSITKGNFTPEIFLKDIKSMCLKFVYVGLGMWAGGFLMITLWNYNGRTISKRMKAEYFKLLMAQEQGYFDLQMPFEFATKIQSQIKRIEMGLGDKVGNTLMSISIAISSFVVGFTYSWKLTLVLIGVLPLMTIATSASIGSRRKAAAKNSKAYEEAGGIAEEILYQIKTVASFANFDWEINRFNKKVRKSLISGKKEAILSGITTGIIFFLFFASYALTVWFGSLLISQKEYNENTKSIFSSGDVITVLFTVVFGAFSLGSSVPNVKAIMEAMSAAYEFFELKKRVPMLIRSGNEKPDKQLLSGKIEFKNVYFSYPSMPDKNVLGGVNFEIEAGKTLAIVGPSGSGKSTIVNLIERLYEIKLGEIYVDEFNIQNLEINYLRSLIGYVAQEPVLFNTTIRENIIFGRENITDDQIYEACEKAYAMEFISKWSEGLDYVVGIRGSKLSGGQKQRIAIARAILCKPKILILDEATSALDFKSEKEVQRALFKVSQGITTIIVAHRLSTIIHADKIIVLKSEEIEINGEKVRQPAKIIEQGNHSNLMNLNGVYSSLVKSQLDNDKIEDINNIYNDTNKENKLHNERECENAMENEQLNTFNAEAVKDKNKNVISQTKCNPSQKVDQIDKNFLYYVEEVKHKKEEIEKLSKSKRKKLWPILKEHPWLLIFSSFFAACAGAVWPVYGIILADSVDGLSNTNPQEVKNSGLLLAVYYVILAGIAGISFFFQNYTFAIIGEYLTESLRQMTFQKYLRLHMGFFDIPTNTPGSLTTQLSRDTTKTNSIALSMLGVIVQQLSALIIGIAISFVFDWRLSLINLSFLPLSIAAAVFSMKMTKGFSDIGEVVDSNAGSIVSECVCNTKTIYSYNMQVKVVEMYEKILDTGYQTIHKTAITNGIFFGFSQFIQFATYATIFFAGGSFIYQGTLEMKNLFRPLFCILYASIGVGQAQSYLSDMSEAKKALINIFNTLDQESLIDPLEIRERKDINKPSTIAGKIEFRNVSFSYPTRPDLKVLKNLNFIINPGQKVAFVGPSGSGKSTIIQLIERFYDPIEGEGQILIDDVDIKQYDLITLRSLMSLVMQEPVLFKTDIFENIRYGKLDATDEEVIMAAQMAKMDEYVKPEYDKTNIPVSGGEKQRIAIARAIIKNPKVLLLDEATSALDSNNEKIIQSCIDNIMQNRTSVTVAHKLSTIVNSDVIFLMEYGSIMEQGTHSELLDKKGKYYSIYKSGAF